MKLEKTMTEFVLQQTDIGMEVDSVSQQIQSRASKLDRIFNYAEFISQSLNKGMFVGEFAYFKHQDGFESFDSGDLSGTIEDLLGDDAGYELTEYAIKKFKL